VLSQSERRKMTEKVILTSFFVCISKGSHFPNVNAEATYWSVARTALCFYLYIFFSASSWWRGADSSLTVAFLIVKAGATLDTRGILAEEMGSGK